MEQHALARPQWPLRYAEALFNLHVVRCLALLDMRLWDAGLDAASARLAEVQGVLDALWSTSPPDQPVLVRDARWLVPVAQSPTTDELGPYFDVAEKIATSLPEQDRLEIHKASVLMAGGHLRSQLRHFNMQGTPLDDHALVLSTRGSNALDFAMTIQGLVTLLAAYERAIGAGDTAGRMQLAAVICQGISPDPQLFVNRTDLLGAYSMIEHLFVTEDESGTAIYTAYGCAACPAGAGVHRLDRAPVAVTACGLHAPRARAWPVFPVWSHVRVFVQSHGTHGDEDPAARSRDALRPGRCIHGAMTSAGRNSPGSVAGASCRT